MQLCISGSWFISHKLDHNFWMYAMPLTFIILRLQMLWEQYWEMKDGEHYTEGFYLDFYWLDLVSLFLFNMLCYVILYACFNICNFLFSFWSNVISWVYAMRMNVMISVVKPHTHNLLMLFILQVTHGAIQFTAYEELRKHIIDFRQKQSSCFDKSSELLVIYSIECFIKASNLLKVYIWYLLFYW